MLLAGTLSDTQLACAIRSVVIDGALQLPDVAHLCRASARAARIIRRLGISASHHVPERHWTAAELCSYVVELICDAVDDLPNARHWVQGEDGNNRVRCTYVFLWRVHRESPCRARLTLDVLTGGCNGRTDRMCPTLAHQRQDVTINVPTHVSLRFNYIRAQLAYACFGAYARCQLCLLPTWNDAVDARTGMLLTRSRYLDARALHWIRERRTTAAWMLTPPEPEREQWHRMNWSVAMCALCMRLFSSCLPIESFGRHVGGSCNSDEAMARRVVYPMEEEQAEWLKEGKVVLDAVLALAHSNNAVDERYLMGAAVLREARNYMRRSFQQWNKSRVE